MSLMEGLNLNTYDIKNSHESLITECHRINSLKGVLLTDENFGIINRSWKERFFGLFTRNDTSSYVDNTALAAFKAAKAANRKEQMKMFI